MSLGEWLGDNGPSIVVAAVIVSEAISRAQHGADTAVALYGALLAAGIWAWEGHYLADRAVSGGQLAKLATWDLYVHPYTPPNDDEGLYMALAQRMRLTDQHVGAFAGRHGLKAISIALPRGPDAFGEARSVRHGDCGHLWLGMCWFHPRYTHHLPAVLEHELAHLRRRDTRKRLVAETSAVAAVGLAAGLLSLPSAALTAVTVWLGVGAVHWWSELACDAAAVRVCGRLPVAAMWSADLAEERTMPWASRTRQTLRALYRHPPLRLRRWFARRAPLPLPDAHHPLTTTPGAIRDQAASEE